MTFQFAICLVLALACVLYFLKDLLGPSAAGGCGPGCGCGRCAPRRGFGLGGGGAAPAAGPAPGFVPGTWP